jgi:AcrR family transcriptional regulator
MKIETEIPDINRDEVIEAMARQLLTEWHEELDEETGPTRYRRETKLGAAMKQFLEKKIDGLAETLVRERFDTVIAVRISAAVDEVLAEGWVKTDEYGGARGPKVDLKARISEFLSQKDRYSSPNLNVIDKAVKDAVDKTLSGSFKTEIDAAVKSLRAQLDAAVSDKFVNAIKAAMGVK